MQCFLGTCSRRTFAAAQRHITHVIQAIEGFKYEIQLQRKCQHPNIVAVIGLSSEKKGDELVNILVMELCKHGPLSAALAKWKPNPQGTGKSVLFLLFFFFFQI